MANEKLVVETSNFKLRAPHATDIWRKAPSTNVFNAVCQMQPARPLRAFSRARITFQGAWHHRYDQAGILLCFSGTNPGSPDDKDPLRNSWIKAGVEFYNDSPRISFVGCDRLADWSLHPLESGSSSQAPSKVVVELRREGDENGSALWAYQLILADDGSELARHPIRECAWAFGNEDCDVQIGAYVCRPAPAPATASTSTELEADFHELKIWER